MVTKRHSTTLLLLWVACATTGFAGGSTIGIQQDIDPACPVSPPVDHVCIENPVFSADCVDQLGAIGGPPLAPTDEGYIGIPSPLVDPILRLRIADEIGARMFAINPAENTVRTWENDFVADIRVCYRPSALAQSADGSEVYVSCHASNAIGVIDTSSNLMVDTIQDRDNLGRPRLQEPMGLAVDGNTLYATSSQSNQVAVINLTTRRVMRYIDIPGQDPRDIALTGNGYLIVANLLAGNRTEPERPDRASGSMPQQCQDLLQDPSAAAVFEEGSPTFMDTSHPDYALIAECYLLEHISGAAEFVVENPRRSDHDLVVVRLSDERVVFSTDSLAVDVGTLNYGVAYDAGSRRVYLATVHARNGSNAGFGNRPLVNRLVILDFDPANGALSLDPVAGIRDLDAPFLDDCGLGNAQAATPYGIDVDATRVVLAAAGSDRLVVTDKDGNLSFTVPVGFGPKGVVLGGNHAFVYNSTGLDVSDVDLIGQTAALETSIGPSQVPQLVRIGARLFNSAQFAVNGTFSCASCHPDGHLDGLVWRLNDNDKLRATMTLQEISETAAYHWDGSKCNQVKILQDGIVNLFGGAEPTDCEMKTMIDFMDGLVRPHSPFRAADDSMTATAGLGSANFHRATFKTANDAFATCTDRLQDMTVEDKLLTAFDDRHNVFFAFGGAGGPIPNTTDSESCGVSRCHVAPHTESDGLNNMGQLIDGFQAVSTLGTWDRNTTMHDGRMSRADFIEALEINRTFHGADPIRVGDHYSGVLATHGFNDAFFRHPEYNFDGNLGSSAFAMTDALTEFIKQEEELQSGAVGLSVVLRGGTAVVPSALLNVLESAANQGKIVLLGVGTLGGSLSSVSWQPGSGVYLTNDGTSLSRVALQQALGVSDAMLLYGGLLPNQGTSPNPKLKAVLRDTSPYLCSEGYTEYQGAAATGETAVALTLRGIDVVAGSRVLIDGQVTGAALAGSGPDFAWVLPRAPIAATVLNVQILGPSGMLSNSLPLPVVPAVIPATEPVIETALKGVLPTTAWIWDNQFGVTGPGTRYDVFRGTLSDLRSDVGFSSGVCQTDPPTAIFGIFDNDDPGPGEGFYTVVRAQNQVNRSSWGSPERDSAIASAARTCVDLFP